MQCLLGYPIDTRGNTGGNKALPYHVKNMSRCLNYILVARKELGRMLPHQDCSPCQAHRNNELAILLISRRRWLFSILDGAEALPNNGKTVDLPRRVLTIGGMFFWPLVWDSVIRHSCERSKVDFREIHNFWITESISRKLSTVANRNLCYRVSRSMLKKMTNYYGILIE